MLKTMKEALTIKRFSHRLMHLTLLGVFLSAGYAQAFEMRNFEDETVRLEDKIGKGKWSVVMFWAHNCGVCRHEMPELSRFHSKDHAFEAEVIGLSIDGTHASGKQLAKQFVKETQPSFTSYLSDIELVAPNYRIMTGEDFRGTPTFLLFSPEGELIANNPGRLRISALEDFITRNSATADKNKSHKSKSAPATAAQSPSTSGS